MASPPRSASSPSCPAGTGTTPRPSSGSRAASSRWCSSRSAGGAQVGQQIVNGLFLGSIYALFALGYTLVFGVLDILNLAHQAVFMLCAYAALLVVGHLHLHMFLAFPLAVLAGGLLGLLVDRVAFRPLRGRSDSNISGLISSIALATILEAVALQLFGPDVER